MMPPQAHSFDSAARAAAKQASRNADVAALASGRASQAEIRRENEHFARLANGARINLLAARSLH